MMSSELARHANYGMPADNKTWLPSTELHDTCAQRVGDVDNSSGRHGNVGPCSLATETKYDGA